MSLKDQLQIARETLAYAEMMIARMIDESAYQIKHYSSWERSFEYWKNIRKTNAKIVEALSSSV